MNNTALLFGIGAVVAVAWYVSQRKPAPSKPGIDVSLPGVTIHMSQPNQPNAGVNYTLTQNY